MESLAVAARMQAGAPPGAGVDPAGGQARLDAASLERMFGVLAGHAEALARLQVRTRLLHVAMVVSAWQRFAWWH